MVVVSSTYLQLKWVLTHNYDGTIDYPLITYRLLICISILDYGHLHEEFVDKSLGPWVLDSSRRFWVLRG